MEYYYPSKIGASKAELKWYPKSAGRPKKKTELCPLCRGKGQLKDKKTKEPRKCVACVDGRFKYK